MQGYIPRRAESEVAEKLTSNPIVAVLGPRQCGKTTLARRVLDTRPGSVRLDLELPSDRRRLADPEAFLALHKDVLVCLDEVQRSPEIFPVLRSHVDNQQRSGQLLILGSASPELLQQASESLAGRIAFVELTPFLASEIHGEVGRLWTRGGFPRSLLASTERESVEWRRDFVRTFLERDVPQLRPRLPVPRLSNFWTMCAHEHGQTLNSAKLAASLGVGSHTIRSYAELLQQTFMVRLLPPCESNLKKRLIKAPKIYLRDSGIVHALLEIDDQAELAGHPSRGASWEGFVIENVISSFPGWRSSFYRTQAGAELDLVMERGRHRFAVECKVSSAPVVTRGFWSAMDDLELKEAYVIAPVREGYPLAPRAAVLPLSELLDWAPRIQGGETHPALRVER